jgi:Domain of unknown function (DUF4209)
MQVTEIKLSVEMLRQVNVDSVINSFEKNIDRDYSSQFNKLAETAKNAGELDNFTVWCLLAAITSMCLRASNTQEPFSAMFIMADCRSAVPEDLADNSLDALSEWLPDILDHELKARIADLLWLRRRKPEYAQVAIHAYLEEAKAIEDPEHWPPCAERLERAFRLAAMFRRKTPDDFTNIANYIEETLDRYDGSDPLFLSVRFLGLLADFKYGDPSKYTNLATSIAEAARSTGNWHKAEQAWKVAEAWSSILKDDDVRNSIVTNWAETYAEQAQAGDAGLISTLWMQKSIELYKRVPNSRTRRDELYQSLRGYQKETLDQMSHISSKVDLTESVETSRKAVSGKSFENALFYLAFGIVNIPDYEDVKRQAQEKRQKYFLSSLFGAIHLDQDGLIVASVPSGLELNDDDLGKAIWAGMLRTIEIHHNLDVQGAIEPARIEIIFEHHSTEERIFDYISNNPFIPHGFEYIYAKGLHAGLTGDFIIAAHLLIPQLENCLRHILQQSGIETTTLNTLGLQERHSIDFILKHPKLSEVIGKDLVLDFQALLIERKYGNLRNKVCHGVMNTYDFYEPSVIYLWWLALRFCLMPFCKLTSQLDQDAY